jgi:hypothetical protein
MIPSVDPSVVVETRSSAEDQPRCARCRRGYPDLHLDLGDLRRARLQFDQLWIREAMGGQRADPFTPLPDTRFLGPDVLAAVHQALRVCAVCGGSICPECWDPGRGRCLDCLTSAGPASVSRAVDPRAYVGIVPVSRPRASAPISSTHPAALTTGEQLTRAMDEIIRGIKSYRFMRRLVLPAAGGVALAALIVLGSYFVR